MQKTLQSLSVVEHSTLKEMGVLWEFFPEATGIYSEDCKAPLAYEKAEDPNVDAVVRSYLDRAAAGMLKYGVTTEDNPLSLIEWLNHLQEELQDATVYIQRTKQELEEKPYYPRYVYFSLAKGFGRSDSSRGWNEGDKLEVITTKYAHGHEIYVVWNIHTHQGGSVVKECTKESLND